MMLLCRKDFRRRLTKSWKRRSKKVKSFRLQQQTLLHMRWKSGRLKRVPLTIRTGSSLLQEQQLKSMIRLFQHRSQMERSWWSFRERSWSKENRMHLPSRQEDCVPHLKQEVIQRGIVHRLHLLKRVRMGKDRFYIYRRHFVPIPEKHWIRRHLFFALWKQSTNNPSVFCVFLETQRPKRLHHLLELSRNISW